MSDEFGKWWPCLKKHSKRKTVWLRHAKELCDKLPTSRSFRYFTLCARPMIDVFMLARENILKFDKERRRIDGVNFCECDADIFPEMVELVGAEEAGFLATLEDLVLFKDDHTTEHLVSVDDVDAYLTQEGLKLPADQNRQLELKRKFLQFRALFPFDFLNIDFCDAYYPDPPDVLRIHQTIDRMLDWQAGKGLVADGSEFQLDEFVAAITCRLDDQISENAILRLKNLVRANGRSHPSYQKELSESGRADIDAWAIRDRLDFFMAAWPKEIARLARDRSWDIEILDHVFYDRFGDQGNAYQMICLVIKFTRSTSAQKQSYLNAVTHCLHPKSRSKIDKITPHSQAGKALLSDLSTIVRLRNEQAKAKSRPPIPEPAKELERLSQTGVRILD